jgi:hypothetical protein
MRKTWMRKPLCLLTIARLSCEKLAIKLRRIFLISFHHSMHEVRKLINCDSLSTDGTDETEKDVTTFMNGGPRMYRIPSSLGVHRREDLMIQRKTPNSSTRIDGTDQEFEPYALYTKKFGINVPKFLPPSHNLSWSTVSRSF